MGREMEQKGNKMTVQQLSMYDLLSVPLWKCVKTCQNYGKHMGTFPSGEPRCEYGFYKDGSTGDDMYQEVDERGHVTFYCKYYRGDL